MKQVQDYPLKKAEQVKPPEEEVLNEKCAAIKVESENKDRVTLIIDNENEELLTDNRETKKVVFSPLPQHEKSPFKDISDHLLQTKEIVAAPAQNEDITSGTGLIIATQSKYNKRGSG